MVVVPADSVNGTPERAHIDIHTLRNYLNTEYKISEMRNAGAKTVTLLQEYVATELNDR